MVKERKGEMQPAVRDYTLNMHKRLQGKAFKKRAPFAVRDVKRFAQKEMFTQVSIHCRVKKILAFILSKECLDRVFESKYLYRHRM